MTTLTERLRELEERLTLLADLETTLERDAVALAQELHALLVECGEFVGLAYVYAPDKSPDKEEAYKMHTKLKQAGIV